MDIVRYDPAKHLEDCLTTWRDSGWLEKGMEKAAGEFISSGSALVSLEGGRAVALATSGRGGFHHCLHGSELDFCSINTVNVALHGRRMGHGGTLTASLLAEAAERGDACAGLGMFEQGFYNRLGFSNMPYWRILQVRPSDIAVPGELSSRPVRLTGEDWREIHDNRRKRYRFHGSLNLTPAYTKVAMETSPGGFALGFRNRDGKLTHHLFIEKMEGENGPVSVGWLNFRRPAEFTDLMLVLASMGDQIDLVRFSEPPGIQVQPLLKKPLASRRRTLGAPGGRVEVRTLSWTQCRILSVESSLNGMKCRGKPVSFNLRLHDPVGKHLLGSPGWRGCGGDYTVHLSVETEASQGFTHGLPVLECSVNSFTRLWNGSAMPSLLPFTDRVDASPGLLEMLDEALPMPEPSFDWEI